MIDDGVAETRDMRFLWNKRYALVRELKFYKQNFVHNPENYDKKEKQAYQPVSFFGRSDGI